VSIELGRRLIASGAVHPTEIEAGFYRQLIAGIPFVRAVLELGHLTEDALEQELAASPAPFLATIIPLPALVDELPSQMCRRLMAVPVRRDPRTGLIDVAVVDPFDSHIPYEFSYHLKSEVRILRGSLVAIEQALARMDRGEYSASVILRKSLKPPSATPQIQSDRPIPLVKKAKKPKTSAEPARDVAGGPRAPERGYGEDVPPAPPMPSFSGHPQPGRRERQQTSPGPPGVPARHEPQAARPRSEAPKGSARGPSARPPARAPEAPSVPAAPVKRPEVPSGAPSSRGRPEVPSGAPVGRRPEVPTAAIERIERQTGAGGASRGAPSATSAAPAAGVARDPAPSTATSAAPPRTTSGTPVAVAKVPITKVYGDPSAPPPAKSAPAATSVKPRPASVKPPPPAATSAARGGAVPSAAPPGASRVPSASDARSEGKKSRPSTPPSTSRGPFSPKAPAAPFADIRGVLAAMESATTRDDVIDCLIVGMSTVARRVGVFAVKKGHYRGVACNAELGDSTRFRNIEIAADATTILAIAATSGSYLGPLPVTKPHEDLLTFMKNASSEVSASLIRVAGRPAVILFADGLGDTVFATKRAEELGHEASLAFSRILTDQKTTKGR
jgi:hypothetical protein